MGGAGSWGEERAPHWLPAVCLVAGVPTLVWLVWMVCRVWMVWRVWLKAGEVIKWSKAGFLLDLDPFKIGKQVLKNDHESRRVKSFHHSGRCSLVQEEAGGWGGWAPPPNPSENEGWGGGFGTPSSYTSTNPQNLSKKSKPKKRCKKALITVFATQCSKLTGEQCSWCVVFLRHSVPCNVNCLLITSVPKKSWWLY